MNMENSYLKNTLILSLGKFATQFISIILLPLFTRYLLVDEYGYIDLIQTYINLFIPVFLFCIDTAIFRFLIDKRENKIYQNKIITNSFIFSAIQIVGITFCFTLLNKFINIKFYYFTLINLLVLMVSNVLFQTCRGIGKNKEYSIATIIIALFNLVINIFAITILHIGAEAILISSIIGNTFAIIYMIFKIKFFKKFNFRYFDKLIIKEMLKYSIPMIPNTLSWWIINVSDRTILSIFLSTAANGIYTISCKFSNIINSIFSIFIMSWQETASLHIDDENKNEFFSKNINETLVFFCSLVIGCITCIPLIFNIIIGNEYSESYKYIPILLISCIFSILTALIGGIYVAKKDSKEIAKTSLLSAIINLIINLIFINYIGIYAACISTFISYFLMMIYRICDVKKYIKLTFDIKKIAIIFILLLISTILYFIKNKYILMFLLVVEIPLLYILNNSFIKDFKNIILIKFFGRKSI